MPKGPQGQKRPADVIGAAVMVAKIATGEIKEDISGHRTDAAKKAARARTRALSPEERSEIARAAAAARWKKSR